jgi:Xylose isomerase-like TIM barrel
MIKRREFLIGSAVAVGAARAWGQSADRAKMDRAAVMSYSFNLIMKSAAHPDDPQRTLDILDFPDEMAQRYGIHNLEIQHAHFRSTEPDYLGEFKNRLTKTQSRVSQLVLELGAHNISTTDPAVRSETIELTNQWIDRAVFLGAARVMINQGTLAQDVRTTAAETLKTIKAYADTKNVMVAVENRDDPPGYVSSTVRNGAGRNGAGAAVGAASGGTPSGAAAAPPARPRQHTWEDEVNLIKAAGVWANPDVASFPDNAAREAGLRVMYAMATSSHFKYMPNLFDSARAIQISKEVGYKGLYSIEAEPLTPQPYPFVQTILDVLLRNL